MLTAEIMNADYGVIAVRKSHAAFYRRKFNLQEISEAKKYPNLDCSMHLMACDFKINSGPVFIKSPVLKPKGYERVFFDDNYQDIWEIGLPVEL